MGEYYYTKNLSIKPVNRVFWAVKIGLLYALAIIPAVCFSGVLS